jgi:hypothetical protein
MDENETIPIPEKLAGDVEPRVPEHRNSETMARHGTSPSRLKEGMAVVLLCVAVGTLSLQFPRFTEPYSRPDPNTNPAVVEADIGTLAGVIEAYRMSRGAYPASLDEVRFPDGLRELVKGTRLSYQSRNSSYTLDWTLPRWHAVYDGDTGLAKVEKTSVR